MLEALQRAGYGVEICKYFNGDNEARYDIKAVNKTSNRYYFLSCCKSGDEALTSAYNELLGGK